MDFESIPHTADIKIRVYGHDYPELFANALRGMFQVVGPKVPGCSIVNNRLVCPSLPESHRVEVQAGDYEQLLVDFLSDALSLSDIHNEAYLDVTIEKLQPYHVIATLHGVKVTGFDVVEIKAVTYHDLVIKKIDNRLQVDIVFDI